MTTTRTSRKLAVCAALSSACLFGAGVPAAKHLVNFVHPVLLAGLFYIGSGCGLSLLLYAKQRLANSHSSPRPSLRDRKWQIISALLGGVCAPMLLMLSMKLAAASSVALVLNSEIVFTVLIASIFFQERLSRRELFGISAITTGGISLAWGSNIDVCWALLLAAGAALSWAIDTNLTNQIAHLDPLGVARFKGLLAGSINLVGGLLLGGSVQDTGIICGALTTGLVCYGLSLSAFIFSLRTLGAARAVAYFAVEPFIGALLSVLLLHEPFTITLMLAGILMAIGVSIHLTEPHPQTDDIGIPMVDNQHY
ncbi:MAG TPA: DMT family transporter [Oculatellaceae cyanobacterium]